MTHHTAKTLALALLTAGLAGCASLPHWSGIAEDSPASPHAQTTPYTPPTNPFASALAPSPGATDKPHNNGMAPGMSMPGMTMPGMKKHKGMMMPGMKNDNGMKHKDMMMPGMKKPDKKNGGTP